MYTHTHHPPESFSPREFRLIFKDIEKPAEAPKEANATRGWLDWLKYSVMDAAAPMLPIKPSVVMSTAEKLTGLKEKTAEEVKKKEKKAAETTSAAATVEAAKPSPDAVKQDAKQAVAEPTKFEKVKNWFNGMYKSMDAQTIKKYALYSAVTLGISALAFMALRRAFGGSKKEGTNWKLWAGIPIFGALAVFLFPHLKKAGGSIAGALAQLNPATKAAADAAAAAQKVADTLLGGDGKDKNLLDRAKDAANLAAEPSEGAVLALSDAKDRFLETFGKQSVEMAEAIKNSTSPQEAVLQFLWHGGQVVVIGGVSYFVRGATSTVLSLPGFGAHAINALYRRDAESTAGFLRVYIGGAVAYATSFGVLDFLSARKKLAAGMELNATQRALWHTFGKSAGWPVEICKKGVRTLGYIMRAPNTGRLILVKAETLGHLPQRWARLARHTVDTGVYGVRPIKFEVGEDGIKALFNEWHTWRELRQRITHLKGDAAPFTHHMNSIEEELARGLSEYYKAKGKIPPFLENIPNSTIADQIRMDAQAGKRGKNIPTESLRDALVRSSPTHEIKTVVAEAVDETAKIAASSDAASSAAKTGASAGAEVFDARTGTFISEEAAQGLNELRAADAAASTGTVLDERTGRFVSEETARSLDEMRAVDGAPHVSGLSAAEVDHLDDFLTRIDDLWDRFEWLDSERNASLSHFGDGMPPDEMQRVTHELERDFLQVKREAEALLARSEAVRTSSRGKELQSMVRDIVDDRLRTLRQINEWGASGDAAAVGGRARDASLGRTTPSRTPPPIAGRNTIPVRGEPPVVSAVHGTDGTGALKTEFIAPPSSELMEPSLDEITRIKPKREGLTALQRLQAAEAAWQQRGLRLPPGYNPNRCMEAIVAAHDIRSLEKGQRGYLGSQFTMRDLHQKMEILREAGIPDEYGKVLLEEGICGDDIDVLRKRFGIPDAAKTVDVAETLSDLSHVPAEHRAIFARLLEAASGDEEALRMLRHIEETKDWVRLQTIVSDSSGDAAKSVHALSAWGKAAKVLDGLGIVGDTVGIAFAAYEAYETHELIKRTPEGELRDSYTWRYGYHLAEGVVSGVGLVAGVVGLTTGAAFATPVTLATLPVSATIAALYQKHKFEEGLLRSSEDWKREFTAEASLVDIRSLGFGEAVGQETRIMLRDGNWLAAAVTTGSPFLDQILQPLKTKLYAWKSEGTRQEQQREINTMNRKRLEAIIEHTGLIKVPVTVRDPGGTERSLNAKELAYYDGCKKTYEEAKMKYLWQEGQQVLFAHGARMENLGWLLQQAEAYARKEHEAYALEHVHTIVLDPYAKEKKADRSSDALPIKEQARDFEIKKEKTILASMMAIAGAAKQEGNIAKCKPVLVEQLRSILAERAAPHVLSFRIKIEETNFAKLWLDSDRGKLTELHVFSQLQQVTAAQASSVADSIVATMQSAASPDAGTLEGLWQNLAGAEASIAASLANPKARFEELEANADRYALVQEYLRKQQEYLHARTEVQRLQEIVNKGGSASSTTRGMAMTKQYLVSYEKMIRGHSEWLKSHPL